MHQHPFIWKTLLGCVFAVDEKGAFTAIRLSKLASSPLTLSIQLSPGNAEMLVDDIDSALRTCEKAVLAALEKAAEKQAEDLRSQERLSYLSRPHNQLGGMQ